LKQPLIGAKGKKEGVTGAAARCAIRVTQRARSAQAFRGGEAQGGGDRRGKGPPVRQGPAACFPARVWPPGMQ